jgi:glycosyltransferase involved in cell wall biosynthesis
MPIVSVIIPTYNRGNLVVEAVTSVLHQTFPNYEIVVVDDGSTDGTAEILSSFVQKGLIRYFYQVNQGLARARNRGIAESKGEIISFLDSDDLFEPELLQTQVEYLNHHPDAGLVNTGFCKFHKDGIDSEFRDTSWFSGWIYPQILTYWLTLMAIDTVAVPRYVLDDVGYFDEHFKKSEDLDLWRRIARKYPFGHVARSLARVRVHEGTLSYDKTETEQYFLNYLDKAFFEDGNLSRVFRRRAYSRLYSNLAYNLLGEETKSHILLARSYSKKALMYSPFNPNGFAAYLFSFFGNNMRNLGLQAWRKARSVYMSRNNMRI